jgi:hypothetical protein
MFPVRYGQTYKVEMSFKLKTEQWLISKIVIIMLRRLGYCNWTGVLLSAVNDVKESGYLPSEDLLLLHRKADQQRLRDHCVTCCKAEETCLTANNWFMRAAVLIASALIRKLICLQPLCSPVLQLEVSTNKKNKRTSFLKFSGSLVVLFSVTRPL